MSEASDGPQPSGEDRARGGDDSGNVVDDGNPEMRSVKGDDDGGLELVSEVVKDHLVAFLPPDQVSDLLSTSRTLSKVSAGAWKTMLANLSGASGNHGTEGNGESRDEGEVKEKESTVVLKDRFRLAYCMGKQYFGQEIRASSSGHTHVSAVQAMDAGTFVTANNNGELKLWNAADGVCIRTFNAKGTGALRLARVDKNTLLCVFGSQNLKRIKLFDVRTGQMTQIWRSSSLALTESIVSLTPATFVTIDSSGYFEVWHTSRGTCVCQGNTKLGPSLFTRVYRLSCGSFVIACGAGFDIRDADTGEFIRLVRRTGGQDPTMPSIFTKTNKMLLSLRVDKTVHAWEHGTYQQRQPLYHLTFTLPFRPCVDPDCIVAPGSSRLVLSCSDDREYIHAWDSENGRLLHTFDSSENRVYSLTRLNPAAFITVHDRNESIKIWRIPQTCFTEQTSKRKAETTGDLHLKRQARSDDE